MSYQPVETYTLGNGIQVIMKPDLQRKLAALAVTVDAGSRHDPFGKSGLAHLFEHLLYTGTDKYPIYDNPIQMAGGDGNAFTNQDFACFYTLMPADQLRLLIDMEADRLLNLRLRSTEFDNQKHVVLEEFKETCIHEAYGDLWHHLLHVCFPGTVYEWPTIGFSLDEIHAIEIEDVRSFASRQYTTSNITLSITGHFDPEEMILLLNEAFQSTPPSNSHSSSDSAIDWGIPSKKIVECPWPVELLTLAYPMVGRGDSLYPIFDLLASWLDNGMASPLYKSLVQDLKVATDVDVYISGHKDRGLFIVELRPAKGILIDSLEKIFYEVWDPILEMGLSKTDLDQQKIKLQTDFIFDRFNLVSQAVYTGMMARLGRDDWIIDDFKPYSHITLGKANEVLAKLRDPYIISYQK